MSQPRYGKLDLKKRYGILKIIGSLCWGVRNNPCNVNAVHVVYSSQMKHGTVDPYTITTCGRKNIIRNI